MVDQWIEIEEWYSENLKESKSGLQNLHPPLSANIFSLTVAHSKDICDGVTPSFQTIRDMRVKLTKIGHF